MIVITVKNRFLLFHNYCKFIFHWS